MKKLLSLFLSIVLVITVFSSMSFSAPAAQTKYELQKQQFNSQYTEFNFGSGKFVYSRYDMNKRKTYLYVSSSPLKKGKRITDAGGLTSIAIKGKYIYYVNDDKGAIMRCKLDGSSKKAIVKIKSKYFNCRLFSDGKRLIYDIVQYNKYYSKIKSSALYACSFNGKNKKLISKGVTSASFTYNNKLYFIKGRNIKSYDFATKAIENINPEIAAKGAKLIGMNNNKLYYVFENDDFSLDYYSADVDSGEFSMVESSMIESPLHFALAYEDRYFAVTGTGGGNVFSEIINGKENYKKYRKLYDTATENVGYYKDNIILESSDYANPNKNKFVTVVKL